MIEIPFWVATIIIGVITTLIGVIWKMLNDKLSKSEQLHNIKDKELEDMIETLGENLEGRIKGVEMSSKNNINSLSEKIDKLTEKIGEKFEDIIERINSIALENANYRTAIFEKFVTKEECKNCQNQKN